MSETEEKPSYIAPPVNAEEQAAWNEYLQKCCEVGQLNYQVGQIEGQLRAMEKHLEVTQEAVKKSAAKHKKIKEEHLAHQKESETILPIIPEILPPEASH